jgi:hypothetical protein
MMDHWYLNRVVSGIDHFHVRVMSLMISGDTKSSRESALYVER